MPAPGSDYQLDGQGHRGSRAVQRLVEYAPASGGLALWMAHRDVDAPPARASCAQDGSWTIGNDGSTLFYGPRFEVLALKEQTGLVAHQVLHVALRHVSRQQQLSMRIGDVDDELYNLCADAIVNASLSHLTWLSLPRGSIMLDTLLQRVLGLDESLEAALTHWDTESLYQAVDDRHQSGQSGSQSQSQSQPQAQAQPHTRSQSQAQSPQHHASRGRQIDPEAGSTQQQVDGTRAATARQLAATTLRDLVPDDCAAPEILAERQQQWSERLLRAHASDDEQSLLRQLLADNQPVRTPWEQLLRTRLQRSLAQAGELNWSRPSRSWIANQGRTRSGRRMPWQPGYTHARRCARLCVLVDVSGSVEAPQLQRFANELDRILRTLRADIHLIIGDDRVRAQHLLRPGVKPLRELTFDGGGSTDFEPMLQAASELRPDLGVFLTDLDGPAGEPVSWPLLWLVPAAARENPRPFGQRIVLE